MSKLKIAHINARSMLAGFADFKSTLLDNAYDIFMITETWFGPQVDDDSVHIGGYSLVRNDRSDRRGGGVCMYIKSNLKYQVIEVGQYGFGQLWIKLKVFKRSYCMGVVYRSSETGVNEFLDAFEEVFFNVSPVCDDIICMGDINIDLLDLDCNDTKKFLSLLEDLDLLQLITEPTRLSITRNSLLDVVICSKGSEISSSGVKYVNNLRTDHELTYCFLKGPQNRFCPIYKTFRDYRNFNYHVFVQDLQSLPFMELIYMNSLDEKIQYFNDLITSLFDRHAPLKNIRCTKPKAPWLTENVRFMIRLRDEAKNRYLHSVDPQHYKYYKTLRNLTTKIVGNEKKAYLNQVITTTGKSRKMWKELQNMNVYSNKKANRVIPDTISDVNNINNYFVDSVQAVDVGDIRNTVLKYSQNTLLQFNEKLQFQTVDSEEVCRVLQSLTSSATGSDGIDIHMINYCCPHIVPYITHIVNSCIMENYYPHIWKTSIVTPLPKIAQPTEFKDLRPISILPTLSKILEKIVFVQLKSHLDKHDILPETQSGFRKNYGCAAALTHIVDDALTASDSNQMTLLVLLDYTRAFDCINHDILLSILHHIGLQRNAIEFFRNYLFNRKQVVRYNNMSSLERLLCRGVPQGSILGPLLFSIYTSQMYSVLKTCNVHCYADDTQLYKSFSPESILQVNRDVNSDLDRLVGLSKDHSLCINPNKSSIMLFGRQCERERNSHLLDISVNNVRLLPVNEAKNLGLIIDRDLRFKKHINNCIKRAIFNLKNIYASRGFLNRETIKMLCDTLVLSHFSYCDVVYGPCLDVVTSMRIQRVQNSCIRLIYGLKRRDHVSPKLKELGWLNMADRRLLHAAVFFHGIVSTRCPPYLYNKIRYRSDIHNLNIRRKSLITIPVHRTSLFERSFKYNIAKIYNSVPVEVKVSNVNRFRIHYKRILLSKR